MSRYDEVAAVEELSTSWPIAQMKPTSSRATAVATFPAGFLWNVSLVNFR